MVLAKTATYNSFIGPGKALDTDKYYVIAVDGIGDGLSSQPKDGLGIRFPRYTVRDMVRAQHDLVTKHLGIVLPSSMRLAAPRWGRSRAWSGASTTPMP